MTGREGSLIAFASVLIMGATLTVDPNMVAIELHRAMEGASRWVIAIAIRPMSVIWGQAGSH